MSSRAGGVRLAAAAAAAWTATFLTLPAASVSAAGQESVPPASATDTVVASPERAGMNDVAFSPDGRRVATSGLDGRVRLWDATTGEEVRVLEAHRDEAYAVAFSPGGDRLATGGRDGTVRIWEPATGEIVRSLEADPWPLDLAFAPDGREIAVAEVDGAVVVHPVDGGTADTLASSLGRGAVAVAWSPDGGSLAVTTAGGTAPAIVLQDRSGADAPRSLRGHAHVVTDVTFLPAGDRLLSASVDASMRVWDLDGGIAMDTLTTRMPSPFAAVAPDGDRLAAGGAGRVVRLWPLDDLSGDSRVLTRHDRTVTGVAFSPCGDRVASVGLDGRLRIARLADGEGACP